MGLLCLVIVLLSVALAHGSGDSSLTLLRNVGDKCRADSQLFDCGYLVCKNSACSVCQTTQECILSSAHLECRDQKCVNKRLFPLSTLDTIATVLMFVVVALAAASGIGGGSALVPIYVLVSGFKPNEAVPISKATILGGAISNLIINAFRKHPHADRPLIDFHLATLFVPTQLLGTMVGVLCNKIWPNWAISLFLVGFLAFLSVVTIRKGWEQHTAEKEAHKEVYEREALLTERKKLQLEEDAFPQAQNNAAPIEDGGSAELKEMYEYERRVPWLKILLLVSLWFLVIIVSLVKGGEGASIAGVKCGGVTYWIIFFIPLPIIAAVVYKLATNISDTYENKVAAGFLFEKGDVQWNRKNALSYAALCVSVGFASGTFGIGGGAITAPLMLTMKMPPQVISATAAFMILFTSSITTTQFFIYGTLEPSYAAWFSSWGFLATFTGQIAMQQAIKKSGKVSLISFAIAFKLSLGSILMFTEGLSETLHDLKYNLPMGLRDLCGAG